MKIQVLVAAMHQKDHSLLEKMKIETDVIVGNQCDYDSVEHFQYHGNEAVYLNFAERGVGLNRNNALMRASGDVLLFADEDEVLCDGYKDIVENAYKQLPDADAVIFNIDTQGKVVKRRRNVKIRRVRFYNALNYGAVRLSVKNSSVKQNNITFHRLFGGGTMYSSGEDSLFVTDLIKKKLKIYTYPATIAVVDQTVSTWFSGYKEKYFYDKGALFYCLSKTFHHFLCLQDLIRHRRYKKEGLSFFEAYAMMRKGAKYFGKGYSFEQYKTEIKEG